MQPSQKSPQITKFLDSLSDRTNSIVNNKCIAKPIGCGGSANEFRDDLSRKEYTISGLCQKCQDKFFGSDSAD